ncbi:GspE/PulE family protein [Fluviibacter phosphoraccumulans]|uniref:Type 4 fimbrial assembly protein PilB n=1 Tax=Fluviibacter phosphoraccumulans TaxID=1751046 RepID=A0A7R6QX18_9RHOO|nr:ATPase, T2SS/T4P/T4SS family [Fluviibacter phosphoraccumulans]BBU68651.1 type 4 fimbrial assembly protein PilB [Fluviibacter phosphoraccumulans]BBU72194.1 type 4 fimbrial assembly protein PilB [Fluviibacter phosphoraccumulans]
MSTLARALIQSGLIPEEAVARCQLRALQRQTSLPAELVTATLIEAPAIARFIETTFGFAYVDLDPTHPMPACPGIELAPNPRFYPISLSGKRLRLAMADPTDDTLISGLRFQTGLEIDPCVADVTQLALCAAAVRNQGPLPSSNGLRNSSDTAVDEAPVVRFLQKTLSVAIERGASDIHFEPYENSYRVRYRIDGVLHAQESPPDQFKDMVASRLKVLSKLDIAEKRLPQDGQLRAETDDGTLIDLRISTMPTLYGEKIVLRILDRQDARLGLSEIGLSPAQLDQLTQAIHQPSGMVLVTGPTGSGKTVTLYACLNALNQPGVNIATVEDPVEIPVVGINQVNIDERTGLTFAVALRAFMRQDPDILMVGEIRDTETAETSLKAAQTGHLVLSTLHTRSAPATLERLRQLGLPNYGVAGSVLLIVAQRLVRRLCECRIADKPVAALLHDAGFTDADVHALDTGQWTLYKANGCSKCHQTGYKGRVGIFEVMRVSPAIQKSMLNDGSTLDIAQQAAQEGSNSLRRAGLDKVMAGLTSLSEVLSETEATEDRRG